MPLPHGVARFNKRVTNRFLQPLAERSRGFVVVHHTGRRSGRRYTTPVNAFTAGDDELVVALTYGPSADWARNVEAGLGTVEQLGRHRPIESVTLVGRETAWPLLPRVVRLALRIMGVRQFLLLRLVGGCGPHRSRATPPGDG